MGEVEQLIKSALGGDAEAFEYTAAGSPRTGWRRLKPPTAGWDDAFQRALAFVDAHWETFHEADVRLFAGSGVFRLPTGECVESIDAEQWPDPSAPNYPQAYAPIYALPGLPTLDIIEFARTGSHNQPSDIPGLDFESTFARLQSRIAQIEPESSDLWLRKKESLRKALEKEMGAGERWRRVRNELAEIMKKCPFGIQFADEAGLYARFLVPVSRDRATRFLDQILEIADESAGTMAYRMWERERGPLTPAMDYESWKPQDEDEIEAARRLILAGEFRLWWD